MISSSDGGPPAQRVMAVARLGDSRAQVAVQHGEHPRSAAIRAARRLALEPLELVGRPWVESGVVPGGGGRALHTLRIGYDVERVATEPRRGAQRRASPPRSMSRPLPRVQRTAAYAVVVDDGRLLLTRLAASTVWTLPGGGIEHGETPLAAVVRELHEETGLALTPGALLDIDSIHFTGEAPDGRWEDYHGIRIIYSGHVPPRSVPQVIEVDGTTEEAAWISRSRLAEIRLSALARAALTAELVARLSG